LTVPSSPPENVKVGMSNNTSGFVSWMPPPPQHHNGILLGYKVRIWFLSAANMTNKNIKLISDSLIMELYYKNYLEIILDPIKFCSP
jgi:Fibronectin type III domain